MNATDLKYTICIKCKCLNSGRALKNQTVEFLSLIHPSVHKSNPCTLLLPCLCHFCPSSPTIKSSEVCVCGELNCLGVICNVNMWLCVRASVPLDVPRASTHINIQKRCIFREQPAVLLLRLNHNCSWASPLSALVHLSQVANRQQPSLACEVQYFGIGDKISVQKTRFIEKKAAGLVMWLCWSNHRLCVLDRRTTCAAFLKKDYV